MTSKAITIHMPKEFLTKWLEGLRSGKFNQGISRLKNSDGSYCCLGVLEEVVDGKVETLPRLKVRGEAVALGLPTEEWLAKHEIRFLSRTGDHEGTTTPYLPTFQNSASGANDSGKTFEQIADAIEGCAEGF